MVQHPGMDAPWLIDDRAAAAPARWRFFADTVMGGVSSGVIDVCEHLGRPALALQGRVRTEFNGGFVQMALDVPPPPAGAAALEFDVAGNGRAYGVHLRTRGLTAPWMAWRARFDTAPTWQTVRVPLASFVPHRFAGRLDLREVQRIGLVALAGDGQPFDAELYLARIGWVR